MCLVRRINAQTTWRRVFRLTRRGDRGEIGHRPTADEESAGFGIESENLTNPIDCQALEFHRRRRGTPNGEIRVQRRGEQVGERCERRARRLYITKHARVRVLSAKGNDVLAKNLQQLVETNPFAWKRGVEPVANFP